MAPANALMVGDHPLADGAAAAAGLYLLPRQGRGERRGPARVITLVDASRAAATTRD